MHHRHYPWPPEHFLRSRVGMAKKSVQQYTTSIPIASGNLNSLTFLCAMVNSSVMIGLRIVGLFTEMTRPCWRIVSTLPDTEKLERPAASHRTSRLSQLPAILGHALWQFPRGNILQMCLEAFHHICETTKCASLCPDA